MGLAAENGTGTGILLGIVLEMGLGMHLFIISPCFGMVLMSICSTRLAMETHGETVRVESATMLLLSFSPRPIDLGGYLGLLSQGSCSKGML